MDGELPAEIPISAALLPPPSAKESQKASANWILFSMGDAQRLEYSLANFYKSNGALGHVGSKACASTLVWSGEAGKNVPVTLFNESKIGFVLNPNEIEVPYADFFAYRSGSLIPIEQLKKGSASGDDWGSSAEESKHPNKMARMGGGMGSFFPVVNHAKWQKTVSGADDGKYLKTGSAEVFAANVFRKYFDLREKGRYKGKGVARLNEALVLQKGTINPIAGIVLDYSSGLMNKEDISVALKVLKERPDLKLYVYDRKQTEHIVRVVENVAAQNLLSKADSTKFSQQEIAKLTPYSGFQNSRADSHQRPLALTLADQARDFIAQKKLLDGIESFDFAKLKLALGFCWGGGIVANTNFISDKYDSIKNEFVGTALSEVNAIRKKQIFNDIVREQLVAAIAKKEEGKKFFGIYQEQFDLLELDKFLTKSEYLEAKGLMLSLVTTERMPQQIIDKKLLRDVAYQPAVKPAPAIAKAPQASAQTAAPNFIIEKVRACRKEGSTVKPVVNENFAAINCPEKILAEFQKLLTNTKILGTKFINPYNNKEETIPKTTQELTAKHLQILARNEAANTTGAMKFGLYSELLSEDKISRLRCLVKATNVASLVTVHSYGGYPDKSSITKLGPNDDKKRIVIDQSGLQWQNDFRNTGGMFFYPDNAAEANLPAGYETWQNDMFRVMYGERPKVASSKSLEVFWRGVPGKIDLDLVALAIKIEFIQALLAAKKSAEDTLNDNDKVCFRFLKAGMGFFAEGIGKNHPLVIEARMCGIRLALEEIAALPDAQKKNFFGKIKRLDLPWSNGAAEEVEAAKIKILVNELMGDGAWGGTPQCDAFAPVDSFVVATTNCGDPHAMPGNEGGYQSVDAAMASNMDNPNILNAAINEDILMVITPQPQPPAPSVGGVAQSQVAKPKIEAPNPAKSKYKDFPKPTESNYVLFSMVNKAAIEYNLENFSKNPQKACSATLMWSGSNQNNVPVTLYKGQAMGFVLDPKLIDVPYADFNASDTFGRVLPEKKKDGLKARYSGGMGELENDYKSKFPAKQGVVKGYAKYATNMARWARWEGEDLDTKGNRGGIYHDKGDVDIFAKNVWKRYFSYTKLENYNTRYATTKDTKRYGGEGTMEYNEALALQKGDKNPIQGIVLDVLSPNITQDMVIDAISILENNPNLRLYIYKSDSLEHIVKYCDNTKAKEILRKGFLAVVAGRYWNELSPLTTAPQAIGEVVAAKETLADSAKKHITNNGLLSLLDAASFNEQKDALLYAWGADIDCPSLLKEAPNKQSKYNKLKESFVRNKEGSDAIKHRQIFNDIAREQIIIAIAKKNPVFAASYQEKFNELDLSKFLYESEYQESKMKMLEAIAAAALVKGPDFAPLADLAQYFGQVSPPKGPLVLPVAGRIQPPPPVAVVPDAPKNYAAIKYSKIYDELFGLNGLVAKKINAVVQKKDDTIVKGLISNTGVRAGIIHTANESFDDNATADRMLPDDVVSGALAFFIDPEHALVVARASIDQSNKNSIADVVEIINTAQSDKQIIAFPLRLGAHFISVVVDAKSEPPEIKITNSGSETGNNREFNAAMTLLQGVLKNKFKKEFQVVITPNNERVSQNDVLCNFHTVLNGAIGVLRAQYKVAKSAYPDEISEEGLAAIREKISDIFGEKIVGNVFKEIIRDAQQKYIDADYVKSKLKSGAFSQLTDAQYRLDIEALFQEAQLDILKDLQGDIPEDNVALNCKMKMDLFNADRERRVVKGVAEGQEDEYISEISNIKASQEAIGPGAFVSYIDFLYKNNKIGNKIHVNINNIYDRLNLLQECTGGNLAKKIMFQKRVALANGTQLAIAPILYKTSDVSKYVNRSGADDSREIKKLPSFVEAILQLDGSNYEQVQKEAVDLFKQDVKGLQESMVSKKDAMWRAQALCNPSLEHQGSEEQMKQYFEGKGDNAKTKKILLDFIRKNPDLEMCSMTALNVINSAAVSSLGLTATNKRLREAISEDNLELAKKEIKEGASVMAISYTHFNKAVEPFVFSQKLLIAAEDQKLGGIEELINNGAILTFVGANEKTALQIAAARNSNRDVITYLSQNVNPDIKIKALEIAIEKCNFPAADALIPQIDDFKILSKLQIKLDEYIKAKTTEEDTANILKSKRIKDAIIQCLGSKISGYLQEVLNASQERYGNLFGVKANDDSIEFKINATATSVNGDKENVLLEFLVSKNNTSGHKIYIKNKKTYTYETCSQAALNFICEDVALHTATLKVDAVHTPVAGDAKAKAAAQPRVTSIPQAKVTGGAVMKKGFLDGEIGFYSADSAGKGIVIAEDIGARDEQQDAAFVGIVTDQVAIDNPVDFFTTTVKQIVEANENQHNGTTFCSVIAQKTADAKDVKFTTANLGDSRVFVVVRNKVTGAARAIALTEDHAPALKRVKDHVQENGGSVLFNRVNGILAVGASVGDFGVRGEDAQNPLLTTPDVWSSSLSTFLSEEELDSENTEVVLFASCDGLFEKSIKVDQKTTLTDNGIALKDEDNAKYEAAVMFGTNMQPKKSVADHAREVPVGQNLADHLVEAAKIGRSTDNISVVAIPIFSGGRVTIDQPMIATVCDGHGTTRKQTKNDKTEYLISGTEQWLADDNLAGDHKYDPKKHADGSLVAASAAAQLFLAAKTQEIEGTEIGAERQLLQGEIVRQKGLSAAKAKTAAPTAVSSQPVTLNYDSDTAAEKFPSPEAPKALLALEDAKRQEILGGTKITITQEELVHARRFLALVAITGGQSQVNGNTQAALYRDTGILPKETPVEDGSPLADRIEAMSLLITEDNIKKFYKRLIEKRPLVFWIDDDQYLLRDGKMQGVGCPGDNNLAEYINYSEMEFGAMLQVSGPTQFINNGSRGNKGGPSANDHEEFGRISAIVGARCEINDGMEAFHCIGGNLAREVAKHTQATAAGGSLKADLGRIKGVNKEFVEGYQSIWGKFYEGHQNTQADDDVRDFEAIEHRLYISYKKFFADSIANATDTNKKAYIRLTGLGDGVWAGGDKHKPEIGNAIGRAARRVFDGLTAEQKGKIAAIEFVQFGDREPCFNGFKGKLVLASGGGLNEVDIISSKGGNPNFAHTIPDKYRGATLCVNFAWDSGSYVGNELWLDGKENLTPQYEGDDIHNTKAASGDPAAACCSSIPVSMNPDYNPQFLDRIEVVMTDCKLVQVGDALDELKKWCSQNRAVTEAKLKMEAEAKRLEEKERLRKEAAAKAKAAAIEKEKASFATKSLVLKGPKWGVVETFTTEDAVKKKMEGVEITKTGTDDVISLAQVKGKAGEAISAQDYASRGVLTKATKAAQVVRETINAAQYKAQGMEQYKRYGTSKDRVFGNPQHRAVDFKGVDFGTVEGMKTDLKKEYAIIKPNFVNCKFDENCRFPANVDWIAAENFSDCEINLQCFDGNAAKDTIIAKLKEVFKDSIADGATVCKIPKREQSKAAGAPSTSPHTTIAQFRLATETEIGAASAK